ncbi:MAG: DoxX family membrane protein [Rhizobiales bacterium]|nr:DoxX family membrane protein [Hyphomicrobiales bacterium]
MRGLFNDASWLDTAGRLLIVAFFLITTVYNLTAARIKDHIDRLTLFKTPFPTQAFWIGIAMEFVGCALILANWHADIGVIILIVFTVLATALLLRFWEVQDPMKRNGMRLGFLANIGIVGGLLLLLQNVY